MRKLFAIALVCLATLSSATVNVSGTLKDPATGNITKSSFVRFIIKNCGTNAPTVINTGVIVKSYFDFLPNLSGQISGVLYGSNEITCGPSQSTYYHIEYHFNTTIVPGGDYSIQSNFSINSPPDPLTTFPTPPAYTAVYTNPRLAQTVQGPSGSVVPLSIKAAAGQSADLLDLIDLNGNVVTRFDSVGNLFAPNATFSGTVLLAADPVGANEAATKAYVDAHGGGGGGACVTSCNADKFQSVAISASGPTLGQGFVYDGASSYILAPLARTDQANSFSGIQTFSTSLKSANHLNIAGGVLLLGTTDSQNLQLQTNSTIRWVVGGSSGNFLPNADNTYDIGVTGTNRVKNVFVGTAVDTPKLQGITNTSVVTNLNADQTDGAHASSTPTASTIPIANGSNKLASGWLPLPTTSLIGAVFMAADCAAGNHVAGIDTSDGHLKCTADSAGGGANATQLQGRNIAATLPTNGQALVWVTANSDWEPSSAAANATQIQSVAVSSSAPATGQLLVYDGSQYSLQSKVRRDVRDYAGADLAAKIAACVTDLPSVGGKCDASNFASPQAFGTNPAVNLLGGGSDNGKSVEVILPAGIINLTAALKIPSNVHFVGLGYGNRNKTTTLAAAAGFPNSTPLVSFDNSDSSAVTNASFESANVDCVDQSAIATGLVGIESKWGQLGSYAKNFAIYNCAGISLNIDTGNINDFGPVDGFVIDPGANAGGKVSWTTNHISVGATASGSTWKGIRNGLVKTSTGGGQSITSVTRTGGTTVAVVTGAATQVTATSQLVNVLGVTDAANFPNGTYSVSAFTDNQHFSLAWTGSNVASSSGTVVVEPQYGLRINGNGGAYSGISVSHVSVGAEIGDLRSVKNISLENFTGTNVSTPGYLATLVDVSSSFTSSGYRFANLSAGSDFAVTPCILFDHLNMSACSTSAQISSYQYDKTGTQLTLLTTEPTSVNKLANLTVQGALNLDPTNSTTSAPSTIGWSPNISSGQAVRLAMGDTNSGMQAGFGQRVQIWGFNGIEIYGGKKVSGPPTFVAGVSGDPALTVFGSQAANPTMVIQGPATPTNDYLWVRKSDAVTNVFRIASDGTATFGTGDGGQYTTGNFVSTVTTGTQPYATNSTTKNVNLNADLVDGFSANQIGTFVLTDYIPSASGSGNYVSWTPTRKIALKTLEVANLGAGSGGTCTQNPQVVIRQNGVNIAGPITVSLTAAGYASLSLSSLAVTDLTNPLMVRLSQGDNCTTHVSGIHVALTYEMNQ